MRANNVRFLSSVVILLTWVVCAAAQTIDLLPYNWDEAGLSLGYPAGWDEPVPSEQDGRLSLQLAQTLSASPETRPPGVPVIIFTLYPAESIQSDATGNVDFTTLIDDQFTLLDLQSDDIATETQLLNAPASSTTGSSTDGLLFGLLRASRLPDGRVLIVLGRAVEAQRQTFTTTFDAVANSLTSDAIFQPQSPTYGTLWHTISTLADGENAFVNLNGLAYTNDRLYTADSAMGLIQFSIETGEISAVYPNADFALPVKVAAADGIVYIADTVCQCVHILGTDGTWSEPLTGFGPESPASIALAEDGSLYATNLNDASVQVRIFSAAGEDNIPFGAEIVTQPMLTTAPDGRVLALTDEGLVLPVETGDFAPLYTLNIGSMIVNDFALLTDNSFLLTTAGQGVLLADSNGEIIDSIGLIVATSPLPGEFVQPRGLAVAPTGTIFVADSDGIFGSVTALSTRVDAGRIGSSTLIPGVIVGGILSQDAPAQDWTFNGIAGQVVTFTAIDATGQGTLDVAIRLLAPNEIEEIYNDDQGGEDPIAALDAQITNHILAASGSYKVRVETVAGSGTYQLGMVEDRLFNLSLDGATQLEGQIQPALPAQRWLFEGQAGQVFTITMQAETGTLDPLLRLWDEDGAMVAENDDAADSALGKNAQIVQVSLPTAGTYTLEAGRFSGEGVYTLIIVATS